MDADVFALAYQVHGPEAMAYALIACLFGAWRKWIRDWRVLILAMLPFSLVWPLLVAVVASVNREPTHPDAAFMAQWFGLGMAVLSARLAKETWDGVAKRDQVTSPWWKHLGALVGVFGVLVSLGYFLAPARDANVTVVTREDLDRAASEAASPPASGSQSAEAGDRASNEGTQSLEELRRAAESGTPEALVSLAQALIFEVRTPEATAEGEALLQRAYQLNDEHAAWLLFVRRSGATISLPSGARFVFPDEPEEMRRRGEELLARPELQPRFAEDVALRLARVYIVGRGGPTDGRRAIALLKPLADAGTAEAQALLADLYFRGVGVPKSDAEGIRYLTEAANNGWRDAQADLAYRLFNGEGVARDMQRAIALYEESAEQGSAYAQNSLGAVYHQGVGVPRDYEVAYFWYLLAAASGDEYGAKNRDAVEPLLTAC